MKKEHNKCLVLNADYTPLYIISWRRALIWTVRHEHNNNIGVEIVDFFKNDYIQGTNKKFPIPAVCKVVKFRKMNYIPVKFSRKNLFIRDNFTCQYCGQFKKVSDLTYDHVIPKSQWKNKNFGTPTNWTNITTACLICNRNKRDRTPKQANMSMINIPERPNKNTKYLPIASYLSSIKHEIPHEWMSYIPEAYLEI